MLHNFIGEFSLYFISLIMEAVGFVLIGSIIGSVIGEFLPEQTIPRLVRGKSFRAILIAGLIGLILPVCECAIVPVAKKLLQKGTPLPVAVTFMLAVPIVNPMVGLSTYIAFPSEHRMVLIRLLSGYILSVLIGLILLYPLKRKSLNLLIEDSHGEHCCSHHHDCEEKTARNRAEGIIRHTWIEFSEAAGFLFIGAAIAALFHSTIPMDYLSLFNRIPGGDNLFMMFTAFVLNLCSEADAFVARSFSSLFPPSALMAFMILGPMLDIKLLAMYRTIFKPKLIATLGIVIFCTVFLWITCLDASGLFGVAAL